MTQGIPCPLCASASRVLETRMANDVVLRRRRECTACRFRFSTLERIISPARFRVDWDPLAQKAS